MWSVEYISFNCPNCGSVIRRQPNRMISEGAIYCLICGFKIMNIPRVKAHLFRGLKKTSLEK